MSYLLILHRVGGVNPAVDIHDTTGDTVRHAVDGVPDELARGHLKNKNINIYCIDDPKCCNSRSLLKVTEVWCCFQIFCYSAH